MQDLPATIYRSKGFLNLQEYPNNQCVLHVVGRRASLQVGALWGDRPRQSRLVFIGSHGGIDPERLESMLDGCRAQRAAARSQTTLANALAWMRKMRETGEL